MASLVRLSRHPSTEPHWSSGVYRFDAPEPGHPGAFGTCYTASSIEVAFAESVIHESGRFVGGSYEVPAAELTERSVVRFTCERRKTLVLADLTGAALKSLGLNNDISASADYTTSQAWSQAIHGASTRWDGIRDVSRQMNKGFAYAIFERSRASQAASRKAQGTAGGRALRSVQCHRGLTAPAAATGSSGIDDARISGPVVDAG